MTDRLLAGFQKMVSHSDQHGMDFYESLKQFAQPSMPDPRNPKAMIPNRQAGLAQTIAGAFGNGDPAKGWQVLSAYHDEVAPLELKNANEASDMIASSEPGSRAYKYAQRFLSTVTVHDASVAGATTQARDAVNDAYDQRVAARATLAQKPTSANLGQPDALGVVPSVTDVKTANQRFNSFKKNIDALSQTEGTYQQFQSILNDVNAGRGLSGAQSVVALFDSIGISATPLAGRGFRVSQNVIAEHAQARGWEGALQQRLLNAKAGDVITPEQVKSYANVAIEARQSQYVNLVNQMHNAGLSADAALLTGNGQKIDTPTARMFLQLSGNDPAKARKAAQQKGWSF